MKSVRNIAALAVMSLGMAGAASANLLVNGSFELISLDKAVFQSPNTALNNGQLDPGEWAVFTQIPGWVRQTAVGFQGPGIEVRNNISGTAKDGKYFVELDSHGATDTNSFMTQTFSSTGPLMKLSFWYAARPDAPGNDPASNGIQVLWNGIPVPAPPLTPGNPALGTSKTDWVEYHAFLSGNVGNNVLGFRAVGIDDTYGGSLDKVAVTVVPEPEAYGLALAGMGVVAFAMRRRQPKAS